MQQADQLFRASAITVDSGTNIHFQTFIRQKGISLMPELLASQPNVSILRQNHYYQLIHQAEKMITENLNYPWTIQDLCKKLYVSQRTLRYAFQKCLGTSPMTYLKTQRLKQVRQQLKASSPDQTTVTDIASQWGFWHMGQFAQDYRKMFGECPSETLRHCQLCLERGGKAQNHALPA